jgi:hypothetical protein
MKKNFVTCNRAALKLRELKFAICAICTVNVDLACFVCNSHFTVRSVGNCNNCSCDVVTVCGTVKACCGCDLNCFSNGDDIVVFCPIVAGLDAFALFSANVLFALKVCAFAAIHTPALTAMGLFSTKTGDLGKDVLARGKRAKSNDYHEKKD